MAENKADCSSLHDDPGAPPWADGAVPNTRSYMESELFVAGALSTMAPFDKFHPAWALPFARQALDALSEWVPNDARVEGELTDDLSGPLPPLPESAYAPLSVVLPEPELGGPSHRTSCPPC